MTVTSNVWFNVTAWASGTFTTGLIRSNVSNIYVCTTGGTGSTAPTGTGSAISGGGTVVWSFVSTFDFGDLLSWSTSIPATPSQPYVARVGFGDPGAVQTGVGTPFLTLSGHATTPSNNITITNFPGYGFSSNLAANPGTALAFSGATGIAFQSSASGAGNVNYWAIADDNVVFNGIQFQDPNPTSNSTLFQSNANITFTNCLFDGYPQGTADLFGLCTSGSGTATFTNCVIIDRSPASGPTVVVVKAYSNLVVTETAVIGINSPTTTICLLNVGTSSNTNTLVNSIVTGYDGSITVGSSHSGLSAVSYSVFTAASLTSSGVTVGSGCQFSKTGASQFVSATSSPNARLLSTATAINAGVTDTTYNPGAVDILGTHRPTGTAWDIGPYEIPTVGAIGTANGHATVNGTVGTLVRAVGTANGQASVSGVSRTQQRAGTANGQATANGIVSSVVVVFGTANGQASVQGFNSVGSLGALITINPIPPQPPNTAFVVSGTYTVYPALQISDDNTNNFTPITTSGITPIGVEQWSFVHPGEPVPGPFQLVVLDSTTNVSASTTYIVTQTNTPASTGLVGSGIFPPTGPTGLLTIIPSYLYEEYADDDNLQGFVQAQNSLAQAYLEYFNGINLPIYTQQTGPLLDWVALGLYGMLRPNLSSSTSNAIGPFNTYPYDTLAMATGVGDGTTTFFNVTDDLFKRMITWNFFKGDGYQFNSSWLKRRVMRFLGGTNGVDYGVSETYQVSVQYAGSTTINITIHAGSQPTTYVPILAAAINANVCQLPFLYSYNVLQS